VRKAALVSIGIPVYNEEVFLGETIQSALAQTYQDIIIHISDNGSTDRSPEIIEDFASRDSRIIYHRQPTVLSPADNFKFLRDIAGTKYFMWLGGHDKLMPGFVEEAVQVMESNPGCSLFYPRTKRIDRENNFIDIKDFDTDTQHLDVYNRVLKVFQNLVSSSLLHGVFRLEQLKQIPLTKDGCEEYLVFLRSAVNGSFIPSAETGLLRREIRPPESNEEMEKRYRKYGFAYTREYSYFDFIAFTLIENIFKIAGLSLKQKIRLFAQVKYFFLNHVAPMSYNRIIYYFSFKKFRPVIVLSAFSKKVDIFLKS
jgi:glycosyltransferase involved in cell wall biosynthesis